MYENAKQMTLGQARQEASTVFLAKVFSWMAVGLFITGVVAFFTANTGLAQTIIGSPLFFILMIAELGLVFYLSARVDKIQASTASRRLSENAILSKLFVIVKKICS